jgi:CDP-diacylglycerol--glycerol-3-phosphate 3-phosphatidyltransferase
MKQPILPIKPGLLGTLLTIPNVLSGLRLVAAPVLVLMAWLHEPAWCVGLVAAMWLTDYADGKLARWLRQETVFGSRLDSIADAAFYGSVLLALLLLREEEMRQQALWIGLAVGSYATSLTAGWLKFRQLPSYHTKLAKTSWLFMGITCVSVFANGPGWVARVTLIGVLVTNLEAILITFILPQWRVNVLSMFHALSYRRQIMMESIQRQTEKQGRAGDGENEGPLGQTQRSEPEEISSGRPVHHTQVQNQG